MFPAGGWPRTEPARIPSLWGAGEPTALRLGGGQKSQVVWDIHMNMLASLLSWLGDGYWPTPDQPEDLCVPVRDVRPGDDPVRVVLGLEALVRVVNGVAVRVQEQLRARAVDVDDPHPELPCRPAQAVGVQVEQVGDVAVPFHGAAEADRGASEDDVVQVKGHALELDAVVARFDFHSLDFHERLGIFEHGQRPGKCEELHARNLD